MKESSGCRKRKYHKLRKARHVRDIMAHKFKIKLYIYKCKPCRCYHLTKRAQGPNRNVT